MTRKKLFDMEIDEISVVDRGANQHAAIVFSKADGSEEDSMPDIDLYDQYGNPVDELEIGDFVYDEDGNEYQFVEQDEGEYEGDMEYADYGKSADYESVEKFNPIQSLGGFRRGFKQGRKHGKAPFLTDQEKRNLMAEGMSRSGRAGLAAGAGAAQYGKPAALVGGTAAGLGGGAAAYGHSRKNRFEKSLGDVVLEELAKADTESERNEIIAKAMQETEIAKAQAAEAWEMVAKAEDQRLEDAFISKAAEYNLPVDPVEFGRILKAASTALDAKQLDLLDGLFNSIGEMLYEEHGYVGDTDNTSVMDAVNSVIGENIGKSDFSPEELSTAVFETNPEAYDQYLAEQNWR
jgi:hypothetical protein